MTLEMAMVQGEAWRTSDWNKWAATIAAWRAMARWFVAARRRHRQRRELAELDDRLLRDIGITRDLVREEMRRRWWQ